MAHPLALRSEGLYQRARKVLPGGNTRLSIWFAPHPPYARSGSGCRVVDVDGIERLDFLNNYTSLIHGHAHPKVIEAMTKQAALGTCFALPTEAEVALAELLCSRVPSIERIRFTNSGTEAVMTAVKAARAFTGRPKIAKCEGAYHGSYDYLEVSLDPGPDDGGEGSPQPVAYCRGTPASVLADVVPIRFNDPTALHLLEAHAQELAAVVIDPLPNRVGLTLGLTLAEPTFLAMLKEFTKRWGALLIFDEVITFRLGVQGAQGVFGVDPDLTVLCKIIGGGFPVGAVAGHADVMAVFDASVGKPPMPHSGTFNANPVTMVAGLATMELLDHAAFERLNRLGDRARAVLRGALAASGVPGQVTGMGSLLRIHFSPTPITDYRSAVVGTGGRGKAALAHMHHFMLDHGILISPTGLMALSTPMGDDEIDQLTETFRMGLRQLKAERILD